MEKKNLKLIVSGTSLIIILLLSGLTINWVVDKDKSSIYRNNELLADMRWSVEAERTWFSLSSWYDKNVKCPKIIKLGGYQTETRCYYPDNYYEQLSRSLINTKVLYEEKESSLDVTKLTPYYKYGSRGSYAGKINERFIFNNTLNEKDFPAEYLSEWNPTDTRNYQLIWRVFNVKNLNLPDGNYHDCLYTFGNLKIDLKDECSKLDRAEIKENRIWFYFNPSRGQQKFNLDIFDPTIYYCTTETIVTGTGGGATPACDGTTGSSTGTIDASSRTVTEDATYLMNATYTFATGNTATMSQLDLNITASATAAGGQMIVGVIINTDTSQLYTGISFIATALTTKSASFCLSGCDVIVDPMTLIDGAGTVIIQYNSSVGGPLSESLNIDYQGVTLFSTELCPPTAGQNWLITGDAVCSGQVIDLTGYNITIGSGGNLTLLSTNITANRLIFNKSGQGVFIHSKSNLILGDS